MNNKEKEEKPPSPKVNESLQKYFLLKQRLLDYFFRNCHLNITNVESMEAYDKPYILLNNSNMKIESDKKYQTYQKSLLKIYKDDLTSFSMRIYERLREGRDMKPEDEILFVYEWAGKYTKFVHWIYKIFRIIERNSLAAQGINLLNQALKILRVEVIQKVYQNLFPFIFKCLEMFKHDQLKSIEPLQSVVKLIGSIGFTKYRHVALDKKSDRFDFVSVSTDPNQPAENSYDTEYYKKHFMNPLIKELKKKYTELTNSLSQLSTPEYIDKAQSFLEKEEKTANHFYPYKINKDIIIRNCQEIIVVEKAETLLRNEKTGLVHMIKINDFVYLKKAYDLLKKSNMTKAFLTEFKKAVQSQGEAILSKITPEDEKAMKKQTVSGIFGEIMLYSEKIDGIRYQIDATDAELNSAQNLGFQGFCNINQKVCNFLAQYADIVLRKEQNSMVENDVIGQIGKISKYLFSLDAFIKAHQKLLGLRILYDNFKNPEAEYSLINQLKSEAGVTATAKISSMIQDLKSSEKWNDDIGVKNKYSFSFEVMMLTSGNWDMIDPKSGKAMVPVELLPAVEFYEKEFDKFMPNRSISWIFNHGRGIAQVYFNNNTKHLLLLNNYQLLALLFLQRKKFSPVKYGEFLAEMKLEDEPFFKNSLMILVKNGILLKVPQNPRIESKDEILSFNADFKGKSLKVSCVLIPKYTEKAVAIEKNELSAQRAVLIDAAIIKLLKQKRRALFGEIISEVQKMCKTFKAEVPMIKQRIENCQQKKYLERDANDMNTLIYVP